MNRDLCQRYLEEPEANQAHLATCNECRAVAQQLDARVLRAEAVRIDALPLAPWEGASHRPWPLIIGGALAIVAIAAALFSIADVSPVAVMLEEVPSLDLLMSIVRFAGGSIQNAPAMWQIGIVISFVAINIVLIVLLRRAPKGLDV
jgi:hypothetical protein